MLLQAKLQQCSLCGNAALILHGMITAPLSFSHGLSEHALFSTRSIMLAFSVDSTTPLVISSL